MFAFFGLDPIHWLIVAVVGLTLFGAPVLVIVLLLSQRRRSAGSSHTDEVAELHAEIDRLRAEAERLKKGSASP
jgi:hypothetical protein